MHVGAGAFNQLVLARVSIQLRDEERSSLRLQNLSRDTILHWDTLFSSLRFIAKRVRAGENADQVPPDDRVYASSEQSKGIRNKEN